MAWRHLKWDEQCGQPSGLPCLLWQVVCPLPCSWVQAPQACLCCCVPSEMASHLHYSPPSWHPEASDGREKGRVPAERSQVLTAAGGSDRDMSVTWAAPGSCCPLASSWPQGRSRQADLSGPTSWRGDTGAQPHAAPGGQSQDSTQWHLMGPLFLLAQAQPTWASSTPLESHLGPATLQREGTLPGKGPCPMVRPLPCEGTPWRDPAPWGDPPAALHHLWGRTPLCRVLHLAWGFMLLLGPLSRASHLSWGPHTFPGASHILPRPCALPGTPNLLPEPCTISRTQTPLQSLMSSLHHLLPTFPGALNVILLSREKYRRAPGPTTSWK